MYQNYIFDLYGTLVDIRTNEQKHYLWEKMALYMRLQGADYTAKELKKAYHTQISAQRTRNLTAAQHNPTFNHDSGIQSTELKPEEIEVSFETLIPALYQAKGVEITEKQAADWAVLFRALSLEHLSLYEGAAALLKHLRGKGRKIYLLSNAQRLFTEPEMRALGIYDYFDKIYYSSDIGFVKPSPHFYQRLLQEQRMNPNDSVMVGNDDKADAWGAHDNGLDSIYIYTKQSPKPEHPLPDNCRVITDLSEILKI
ncbi:MAG: HAD family hydrolase [Lachnospiraceae bacterium]|nr:HAD family hydrolase [Lachnospiraceae bacterium]